MSDIVKRSGWNRQFKSHDKINKRLMTDVETTERDVNNREQIITRETRQETNIILTTSFVTGPISLTGPPPLLPSPPPPPLSADVENVLDTPFPGFAAVAVAIVTTNATTV